MEKKRKRKKGKKGRKRKAAAEKDDNEVEKSKEKGGKKKAELRKTRSVTKIVVGKKAADKLRKNTKDKQVEEENIMDCKEEEVEEVEELNGKRGGND